MPEEIVQCSIPTLAAEGVGFNGVDEIDAQSARVYILAILVKSMPGGPDYTDICSLAKLMQQYDGLPDYVLRAANMQAWANLLEEVQQTPISEDEFKAAIACGHCCDITAKSMKTAETYLWCLLTEQFGGPR